MHGPLLRAFHAAMPAARSVVLTQSDGGILDHDMPHAADAPRVAAEALAGMTVGTSALVSYEGGDVLVVRMA